jgi:hypothetical protein
LVARVDGKQLHALFCEQSACELHRGHKAEPNMEAGHQAVMKRIQAHGVKNKRECESGNHAGNKRAGLGRAGAFLHFLRLGFVAGVVAHFAHPRLSEKERRILQETQNHSGNGGDQNGEPVQMMNFHVDLLVFVIEWVREKWPYPMTRRA